MYIVGFNGPPQSGKDTLARMLSEHMESQGITLPVWEVSLSQPLRVIAYAMTGYIGSTEGENYEAFKVKWFSHLDRTGRELMIDISEKFLKPTYGESIMVDLLAETLNKFPGVVLIRDCGFNVEARSIANWVSNRNLYLVQVHRDGCDFSNDSREWVEHHFGQTVENNFDLSHLRTEAGRIYGRLVNQQGWTL